MDYLARAKNWFLDFWWSLSDAIRFDIWLGVGFVWFVLSVWVSYRVFRWSRGDRRVNGVWFRSGELDEFLDRLTRRELDGGMLSLSDQMLLQKYRGGRRLALKTLGRGDFVSW